MRIKRWLPVLAAVVLLLTMLGCQHGPPREAEARLPVLETPEGHGMLVWEPELANLHLVAMGDGESIQLESPGTSTVLTPGIYQLRQYTWEKQDADGDIWRLRAQGSRNPIEVHEGKVTRLPVGEPYVPRVEARAAGSDQRMSLRIEGADGERVVDVARISGDQTTIPLARGGRRPKEPGYRILCPDGEIVAQGNFEYG